MKITNTNDIESQHVFALIVGQSGSGKTFTASTLPPKDTLILSAESGLLTLKGSGIDVWTIESFSDLLLAYSKLHEGTEYKNIFVDSLSEISEMCFTELRPQFTKSKNFELYEKFSTRMIACIKAFRDLTAYNTFMTCLLKESDNSVILDVQQKSLGFKIPAYFDFCFAVNMFEKDGKKERALVSDNSVLPMLKSRSDKIDDYERVNLTAILEKALS